MNAPCVASVALRRFLWKPFSSSSSRLPFSPFKATNIAPLRDIQTLRKLIPSTLLKPNWLGAESQACYSKTSTADVSLSNQMIRKYLEDLILEFERQKSVPNYDPSKQQNEREITLINLMKEFKTKEDEMMEMQAMADGDDKEMAQLAAAEIESLRKEVEGLEDDILYNLVPWGEERDRELFLEVTAGAGGQEAMLFTLQLFKMYSNFSASKGWSFQVTMLDASDIGGTRKAGANISGPGAYALLKYEGGIHRVQRVPKTEKSGRVHTSTVSVAVLPQPDEIEVNISPKDLRIDTFRAGGAGGQHVNKTDSAVRVTHLPTGMMAESQESRSQHHNKDNAMRILKTRMYEQILDAQISSQHSSRKLQIGSKSRSEKMRTYNFQQDRVTDHRVGLNLFGIDRFMEGGEVLDDLLHQLKEVSRKELILEIVQNHHEKNVDKS